MREKRTPYRFLFAGGGTGGHLFPAVAVAERIKNKIPEAEILFVGTKSKIEGRVVPQLGYKFKSIWIKGFSRKINIENFLFPLKVLVSIIQSIYINMKFKPKVAIGSGGYVSGPAIFGSSIFGAKIILIEQNSYPGVTTRLLEKYADEIYISFEESKKYFRHLKKLFLSGNPVRSNLNLINKNEALKKFNLLPENKTLLVLGGSLGAKSINEVVSSVVNELELKKVQIIWQTGSNYFDRYKNIQSNFIKVLPFIDEMNVAYSACDILLARAGATTIAEVLNLGIPSILVPSPNVAENHQYFNAKSLSDNNAAILIEDKNLQVELKEKLFSTIFSNEKLDKLKDNALLLAKPDAADIIAQNAIRYAEAV
ncbi:MAG: undecaprenyldiphospho-muramoylpentapeptide beta-N-acetylglucosaminyltransferase [Bacteroidetes bacterium]|nr:undecaprenyldiphospho-muramoylpentapeptide beta-N-acetylglucosaminyltransferase [Bacteroidota bacterium]